MSGWIVTRVKRLFGSDDTMSCREVGKVLQSYLDSELDAERGTALAAHLEACRDCGLEAAVYEEVRANLASLAAPVPPDTVERLRAFGDDLVKGGY